jgi:hypothetical protein
MLKKVKSHFLTGGFYAAPFAVSVLLLYLINQFSAEIKVVSTFIFVGCIVILLGFYVTKFFKTYD